MQNLLWPIGHLRDEREYSFVNVSEVDYKIYWEVVSSE